jgi:hypothetical protein
MMAKPDKVFFLRGKWGRGREKGSRIALHCALLKYRFVMRFLVLNLASFGNLYEIGQSVKCEKKG